MRLQVFSFFFESKKVGFGRLSVADEAARGAAFNIGEILKIWKNCLLSGKTHLLVQTLLMLLRALRLYAETSSTFLPLFNMRFSGNNFKF